MLLWTSEPMGSLMFFSSWTSKLDNQVHSGEIDWAELKQRRPYKNEENKNNQNNNNQNKETSNQTSDIAQENWVTELTQKKKTGFTDDWKHPFINKAEWSGIHKIMEYPITFPEKKELPKEFKDKHQAHRKIPKERNQWPILNR